MSLDLYFYLLDRQNGEGQKQSDHSCWDLFRDCCGQTEMCGLFVTNKTEGTIIQWAYWTYKLTSCCLQEFPFSLFCVIQSFIPSAVHDCHTFLWLHRRCCSYVFGHFNVETRRELSHRYRAVVQKFPLTTAKECTYIVHVMGRITEKPDS